SCAETFGGRAALAAAELSRLENRAQDAERLYDEAIRSATAANAPNVEAIANEMAARCYLARGLERMAQPYLGRAQSCYRRWGAGARRSRRLQPGRYRGPAPGHGAGDRGTARPGDGIQGVPHDLWRDPDRQASRDADGDRRPARRRRARTPDRPAWRGGTRR